MSDNFAFVVEGSNSLTLKLDEFPRGAHQRIHTAIDELTDDLETRVLAAVPRRSGKLARSIRKVLIDKPDRISGEVLVDADFAKAGALEYGAHRRTKVSAHQMKLAHLWSRVITPITVDVPTYSRTPNVAEHDFLRGPSRTMQSQIEIVLGRALDAQAAQT